MLPLLFFLGCGLFDAGDTPVAPAEPPPVAAPEPDAARSPLDVGCASELVAHYETALTRGCTLERVEGGIGLTARVLRNVPFAARKYTFKSDALRGFFVEAQQGCDAPWYSPGDADVVLPAGELACVKELKQMEAALDREHPVPDYVEDYLLAEHASELLGEVARQLGEGRPGDKLILREDEGAWTLTFYSEDTIDGESFESAVVVTCRDGRCETMYAG